MSKQILMGITHCRSVGEDEEVVRQEQLYGKIVRISYEEGVVVLLADGNETDLPPDLSLIQPGPPGRYRLRSTGEAVEDPDFITMWEEGEAREPS